jgi:hypothetical protein
MKTLESLKDCYKEIIKENGEKAYSSSWMYKEGYSWLYQQVVSKHKIRWDDFRKMCGITESLHHPTMTFEDIIIVKETGTQYQSSHWLAKNGKSWLVQRLRYKGIKWSDFMKVLK